MPLGFQREREFIVQFFSKRVNRMVNNLLLLVSCFLSSYSASDDLIRLAGSNEPCSGRVEIYHNGVWGTVCDDGWDLNDAAVACRQLGCGPAEKALTLAHFGQGTGQIWLDDVVCSGNEPSLAVCGHREFGTHDCGHHEDAGVNCSMSLPKPTITIQPTGLIMWGQDVQITCSITGGEVGGSFIFTKTPGSFTQTVDSSSSSTILHLHQVNFTNEGSYQCQFQRTDSSSVFSDYVNLKVTVILPKPSIAMDPAGVVTFGDLIAINCSVSTQYLGGSFTLQKTSGSFTKTQQSSTNSSTFRFLEANDNHVGDYRCYYETLVEYKTFTSPLSDNVTVSVTYD